MVVWGGLRFGGGGGGGGWGWIGGDGEKNGVIFCNKEGGKGE